MKCLEMCHQGTRPAGYGMIGLQAGSMAFGGDQNLAPRITSFPMGRIIFANFPGISCLATFITSLRD